MSEAFYVVPILIFGRHMSFWIFHMGGEFNVVGFRSSLETHDGERFTPYSYFEGASVWRV